MNIILKILKNTIKIIFIILYTIFCFLVTVFIAYNLFIVCMHSIFTDNGFDFQIIFYIILSLSIFIGLWSMIFIKIPFLQKVGIFIVFLICIICSYKIPSVIRVFEMDYCIDTGICPEGIEMKNDDDVLFEINKENCIKYGYKWYEGENTCNLRIKTYECEKQGYTWIYNEHRCSHNFAKNW